LSQNTGTAEILRLPEVQAAITGDFVILPCDLICEVAGESLLEAWMIQEGGLGGATGGNSEIHGPKMGLGGERGGRRGGLGVWYQTKGDGSVKCEETDFVATASIEPPIVPPPEGSLRSNIANLVYSTPTDTLNDITEEKKSFPIRHSLLRKHGRIKLLTTYRDAHVYFFPYWILDMVKHNQRMDSISEDVVGWWAKSGWQDGLGDKLGLREIFEGPEDKEGESGSHHSGPIEEEIDLRNLSTTWKSDLSHGTKAQPQTSLASRVPDAKLRNLQAPAAKRKLKIPPMLAYIHPPEPTAPLIRRVDTAPLLLSVSLRLAKLESVEEVGRTASSPFAHTHKIAFPGGVAQRCTVTRADCLLAENVTVEEKAVVKESVIGVNCHIKSGARLTRCVLMDGAVVGEGCQLTGCILGRRCQIGRKSTLKECEVQEGNVVPEETEAKNEKFMVFEGLDDGDEGDVNEDAFDTDENVDMVTQDESIDRD